MKLSKDEASFLYEFLRKAKQSNAGDKPRRINISSLDWLTVNDIMSKLKKIEADDIDQG